MDLLQSWRRRLLGGVAATVLIPIGIVAAALAVGFSSGGFGGLGALHQALSGPQAPVIEPAAGEGAGGADDPARALRRVATRARRLALRRRAARLLAAAAPPGAAPGRGVRDGRPGSPRRRRPRPPQGESGGPPGGGGPGDPPGPVRQIGDALKETTDDVPVAGEPAGQVIDTIVETAEQLPRR